MGDSKLWLLLLLSTTTLVAAQFDDPPTCLLAKRYKTMHKYEYQYEAESLNSIDGGSLLKNGPKAICKVEIEVPQTCSFIVRTTGCRLSEVVGMDPAGNPEFRPAPTSDVFAAEMERYPLKVVVEGRYNVKLYPEEGETSTILNVKRGILSALAVPLIEEDQNSMMPTIHGMCQTSFIVNSRQNIATDVSLTRDLSRCDKFVPIRDHSSSLALISGLHYPLAQLISSSQTCNYKFDNDRKHMTSTACTETHVLLPFSNKGKSGVTSVGKQLLTLVQVSSHNDRVFDHTDIVKGLHMEAVTDKFAVQDKNLVLFVLRELASLPETEGERRAHLFFKLVTVLRGMTEETLILILPEAQRVSSSLTYQALAQCGTPACNSAILEIFKSFDEASVQVDAAVFALGLVSNPSPLLIHGMLEMAKIKPSRPVMYALSNVVKRFYKAEEKLIPEIHAVANFMAAQLGDCTGEEEKTFLTLRVVGNMAPAVMIAGPALRMRVIQCMNQAAASASVQQAAIQVFRLTPAPREATEVLMRVVMDRAANVQKRVAAYLVLMKNPEARQLVMLTNALKSGENNQFKSFVVSHMTNIMSSTEPETKELRMKIRDAVQGNEIGPIMAATKFSRNYRMGSIEGNMIFEGSSYLPKEVMLEMTLKAFGFDVDMMEIGMEGTGLEPTVDALFGKDGFFPSSVLRTMYFVSDSVPLKVKEVMYDMMPALKRESMKRKASQGFIKEIGRNLNKLMRDLKNSESPEATVYMKLLGNEMGYMKTKDIQHIVNSASIMADRMFKMFPAEIMKDIMARDDNTFFAHYLFMDNQFFLPTVTGFPLKVVLSGTFAPGVKGGLKMNRGMNEFAFMPSANVEFVTRMGAIIPEFVNSGMEMHTNMFHESGLKAKISMGREEIKMTIPALSAPTKILKVTNTLVSVTSLEVKAVPPMVMGKVEVNKCTPFFTGMRYCSVLQYSDLSEGNTPYSPFIGDSKFAVELHPTGEVTEYTASLVHEVFTEGNDGKENVESLKFVVRSDGAEPTEASAVLKYNMKRNTVTADVRIPDFDFDAGLRLGVVNGNTRGRGTHSIHLDFINKNIPVVSLIGRVSMEAMKKGMLQVQLLAPTLATDASVTATVMHAEDTEMELRSEVKFLNTMSNQKIIMKYDSEKVGVEFKSDMNADTNMLPISDLLMVYGNKLLDTQVGRTDIKVRHIFKKFGEAANNYMEKYGAEMPYIQNLRVPEMPEISIPEMLFMNVESKAVYYFNNERFNIMIPIPVGGKSTSDLNFPPVLSTPHVSVPQLGLEIVSMEIPIPQMVIPPRINLAIPLFGKAEVSTMMKSNMYDMEASLAFGKDVVETPSYSAKVEMKGTSPLEVLGFKIEGSGMLATKDAIKAQLAGSLVHKFIEARVSLAEDLTFDDKMNLKSTGKIEATSPFGLNFGLDHTGMAQMNSQLISGESNFDGRLNAGPIVGKTISVQTVRIIPSKLEARIESTFELDSNIVKAKNRIGAALVNGELLLVSNTDAFENNLRHVAELSFKENKLALRHAVTAIALGTTLRNQAETTVGAGEVLLKIETNAARAENLVNYLLMGSLNAEGFGLRSEGSAKMMENEVTHKAILTMNKDGITTSGSTILHSPVSFENTFNAVLDMSKAAVSISNNAAMRSLKFTNANSLTVTPASLNFISKAETAGSEYASYGHDITFDIKPYTAAAQISNNIKLLSAEFVNDARLLAELYKLEFTGSMKAFHGQQEIKHIYQVSYKDRTAIVKGITTGMLFGNQMTHNTELEIVGLAAKFTNEARISSQPIRYDHSIRCSVIPFDFNLDALFNADGDVALYGKHSAQLYGRFLMRAQPLAFGSSHEYRASMAHKLENGISIENTFDNKMDTVLSVEEQKTSLRMKSKINEHAFDQEMSIYNTAERIGMELSSMVMTNLVNPHSTDNQEFSFSGFLKYDKTTNCHMIHLPLMEHVPLILENLKEVIVSFAEALQKYINDQEVQAKLEMMTRHMIEFVTGMDLEGKAIKMKEYLDDLTKEYAFTMEDVDFALRNLKITFERVMVNFSDLAKRFLSMMREVTDRIKLPEVVVQKIQMVIEYLNEEFDIKESVKHALVSLRDMIDRIDLDKLKGGSLAFICDIDNHFRIRALLKSNLDFFIREVDRFDLVKFCSDAKRTWDDFWYHLWYSVVTKGIEQTILDTWNSGIDLIRKWIKIFNVVEKINAVLAKSKEMLVKLGIEKQILHVVDRIIVLVKQFDEMLNSALKTVKDADIPAKVTRVTEDVIAYVKHTDAKEMIRQLSGLIETILHRLKSMKYKDLVAFVNFSLYDVTDTVNRMITTLEIPQKVEAAKELVNAFLVSLKAFVDKLGEIKVSEVVKSVKEMVDFVVFDSLKASLEHVKMVVEDLKIKDTIDFYLSFASKEYRFFIKAVTTVLNKIVMVVSDTFPDQKFTEQIKGMVEAIIVELRASEVTIPSFIVPFTDLVVPSVKIRLAALDKVNIPTELDIPEFKILGKYTVKATKISFDKIKEIIIELIDYFMSLDMSFVDVDAFFGDLRMSYLPYMPEIRIPEFHFSQIPIPQIPPYSTEQLVKSLQIPEIQFPVIPTDISVPCFGKLYGEMRFNTPVYAIKTSAEFLNSTESALTPKFTGSFSSQGTSPSYEILNYKFDASAHVAMPKRSRVVLTENVRIKNVAFGVEHQASLSLYGLSAQGQAKTTMKVTTEPYKANVLNTAFIAMEEGMSASLDTTYNHVVEIPSRNIKNEAVATQKVIARQNGFTLSVTVDNIGKSKFDTATANHKSNLQVSLNPKLMTLDFTGDTDSPVFKMRQQVTAESHPLSHLRFSIRSQDESPMKNTMIVSSGIISLHDIKAEMKVDHNTELFGSVNGVITNGFNLLARPFEVLLEAQNRGKLNVFEKVTAKIELQNDYSVFLRPANQLINTVALARLNQYKMVSNLTVLNDREEAGVVLAMDGDANLDFLKYPITIPEFEVPFLGVRTPELTDVDLYEQTGLKNILVTTEQNINLNAKVVYQKMPAAPRVDVMGLMTVPPLGNLITELTFKSAVLNLNLNAGLFTEEDLVFRLAAITASEFESLRAKLDGTASLTLRSGMKLANSMSLVNPHIEGTHDCAITLSAETLETAVTVATVAKVTLPVFNLDVAQNLVASTKTKEHVVSTLRIKSTYNIPMMKAVGNANADHSLKLEGTLSDVSVEAITRTNVEGTLLEGFLNLEVLNEANVFLNHAGLRSTSKLIGKTKLHHATKTIFNMDVDENLSVEASLSRVFAALTYNGVNEVDMFSFTTKGKHMAKATLDLAPISSMTANIEIDVAQPSSAGDFSIYDKTAAEVTATRQKIDTNTKLMTPVYSTIIDAVIDGSAPVFTVALKSSAKSVMVFLDYDMSASSTTNFENAAMNMVNKFLLTHTDMKVDLTNIINQALWTPTDGSYTLNADITSPTFTDMNLRCVARREVVSASVSIPSVGFLGLQFNGRVPSQMSARIYGRYPSAPEVDVDILVIRAVPKDSDKLSLQIVYDTEAPITMVSELRMRLPSIMASFSKFADKYQITKTVTELWSMVERRVLEAYDAAIHYDMSLSQLSIFFRNTVVQYQKSVEVLLEAVVKFLREAQFKIPGTDRLTTLPEVFREVTSSFASMLDRVIRTLYEFTEVHFNMFVEKFSQLKFKMPLGDAVTGAQIVERVKTDAKVIYAEVQDIVRNMESLDTMVAKISETFKALVVKTQDFVDSIRSDYLDDVLVKVNELYRRFLTLVKEGVDEISRLNVQDIRHYIDEGIRKLVAFSDWVYNMIYNYMHRASEELKPYLNVSDGRFEFDIAFPFQQ
ncbi:apolipoprotein Bb, tandem duplicate 1 [Synchiropus splendidus]|uniref:apolipoprotein Bb, tandem duplicate 1 n=1 Tax=Synchiropus splendidus TaxID=270530 RepID=UPI00237D9ECF|nr:apolipoprotein Bb, tandem duplicate 1 [Synchiropus splendidus]XP_053737739.1 apolipoprotein Bb, tandem duplicate 1 [Synchiropus splendidus]XP_053737741.1 apolipoprotein Bb, tandem duplicate 1 [Synchiropus splendidus]XP_053737742.1 apolipoprotein Bb, tandem duplicate 1 [Synchiropus splendidus]